MGMGHNFTLDPKRRVGAARTEKSSIEFPRRSRNRNCIRTMDAARAWPPAFPIRLLPSHNSANKGNVVRASISTKASSAPLPCRSEAQPDSRDREKRIISAIHWK